MGELTALAWILIVVALLVGGGIGFAARRPKTIVHDADAKRLEHLAVTNARLESEIAAKATDNKAWADSHQALADQLESTKGQLESATNPPELAAAREQVASLTTELERAKEQAAKVEALNADLDIARGRAAALERELTEARTVPQVPVEDFTKAAAASDQVGVLKGQLAAAKARIAVLEAQLPS